MSRLLWGQSGTRFYETGVDRGVLYTRGASGVAWNGLVSVTENTSGGESNPYYFDGNKYLDFISSEDFQATIEAYSAPTEFAACNGSRLLAVGLMATQQPRDTFGLSYRTLIGSDLNDPTEAYKLHLVYNATASPSGRTNKTLSDSPDPETLQWTIDTVPVASTTFKPTAHFIIDSRITPSAKLAVLEDLLYGTTLVVPALPTQATVISTLS